MSTEPQPSRQTRGLRAQMVADHERLSRLFDQVLIAFQEGDQQNAAALWSQFETGLRNHFDFEELHLFPKFQVLNPVEIAALQAEHAHMLSMLEELSIGVDLHLTRSDMVEDFVARLRAHAEREDALLYRWADARNWFVDRAAARVGSGIRRRR
jgi:hemerythrin-like domain-containing protein